MIDRFDSFRQLHEQDGLFIMANAWNAGSAVLLADAGFTAIGTSSAGIAYENGLPDYEGKLGFSHALEATRHITTAVDIPVNMDAENGYAHTPEELADNLATIASAGVAGVGIEDFTGDKRKPLYEVDLAIERIQAARAAINSLSHSVVLTARAECYLTGHENPFEESVKRLNHYREAGADVLFAPGMRDIDTISALVREVDGPVNVVIGLNRKNAPPITLDALREAGVKRVSIGGSLARATFGLIRQAAREMLDHGSFEFQKQQIADGELCKLFSRD